MVYHVVGVRVNDVVMIFGTEVVCFVVRGIHLLMILIRTHSTTLQIFPVTHHSPTYLHIRVNIVGVLTKDLSVNPETRLSMNSFPVMLRTLVMTNIHMIHQSRLSSLTVVSNVVVHTTVLIVNQETRLSMSRFLVTIITHMTHSHISFTVVITVEGHTSAQIVK